MNQQTRICQTFPHTENRRECVKFQPTHLSLSRGGNPPSAAHADTEQSFPISRPSPVSQSSTKKRIDNHIHFVPNFAWYSNGMSEILRKTALLLHHSESRNAEHTFELQNTCFASAIGTVFPNSLRQRLMRSRLRFSITLWEMGVLWRQKREKILAYQI